jgi:hypothetical protein
MTAITNTTFWVKKVPDRPYISNPKPLRVEPTGEEANGFQVQTFEDYLANLRPVDREIILEGSRLLVAHRMRRINELYIPTIQSGKLPEDTARFRAKLEELGFRDMNHFLTNLFSYIRNSACMIDEDNAPMDMCWERDES